MVARQWRRRSRALVAGGIIIEETYQLVLGKKRFFAGPPRAQDATQAEPKTQVQNRYLGHPAEKSNPRPRYKTGTWGTRRKRATQDPGTHSVPGAPSAADLAGCADWVKAAASCRTPKKSGEIEGALEGALFGVDFFLELENGVEDGFGAGRAAGDVHVHGNDLIATLHDGVIIEDAAGSGAGSHGDDPLGLRHLIVKLANDRSHFLRETSGNNHEIGLAGRGTKNFGAEAGQVVAGGGHGHHFYGAAGEAETQGPNGAFASPVHGFIELGEDDAFILKELAEIIGLGEGNAFAEGGGHVCLCDAYLF